MFELERAKKFWEELYNSLERIGIAKPQESNVLYRLTRGLNRIDPNLEILEIPERDSLVLMAYSFGLDNKETNRLLALAGYPALSTTLASEAKSDLIARLERLEGIVARLQTEMKIVRDRLAKLETRSCSSKNMPV